MPPKRSEPVSGLPNPYVQSFTHLKDKPDADRALATLKRIASLVKPIMRKHSWTLPVLAEFYPDNPGLLGMNVNGGQKILIRLRPHFDQSAFREDDDLVGVMLHELTHNVHGPHDDKFYKFLDELESEYDELRRTGYQGEGFDSPGTRVGIGTSHDLPPHLARLKALEAAEKRRAIGSLSTSGGSRLGGRVPDNRTRKTPRELAAEAAERRARDAKTCASGEEAEKESKRAAEQSITTDVIDLTADDEPVLAQPRPAVQMPLRTERVRPTQTPVSRTKSAEANPRAQERKASTVHHNAQWECPTCTLLNAHRALQCDACLTTKPFSAAANDGEWICITCGEGGNQHEFWTCRFCGTMRPYS